jgi:hypothetical protein
MTPHPTNLLSKSAIYVDFHDVICYNETCNQYPDYAMCNACPKTPEAAQEKPFSGFYKQARASTPLVSVWDSLNALLE